MKYLTPDWPAPDNIRAAVSVRPGGASTGVYAGLNLARHVGDDPNAAASNRREITESLDLPSSPMWMNQVHGTRWLRVESGITGTPEADAALTAEAGLVCAVLTADCLPVLFCSLDGRQCGVAHAGWRGTVQ